MQWSEHFRLKYGCQMTILLVTKEKNKKLRPQSLRHQQAKKDSNPWEVNATTSKKKYHELISSQTNWHKNLPLDKNDESESPTLSSKNPHQS